MGDFHPKGYSREHALGVFSFLELINIATINNFVKPELLWSLPVPISFTLAIILYFVNRHFLINEELKDKPSILMIITVILYIIGSIALMILSFKKVVPK